MPITNKRLEELRGLYKEEFGEEIDLEEAQEMAQRLVELYMMLAEPLPSERAKTTAPPPPSDQVTNRTPAPSHQ